MFSLTTLFHRGLRICYGSKVLKDSYSLLRHIRDVHWHFRKAVSNLFEHTPWSVKVFEHIPYLQIHVYIFSYVP